MIKKILMVSQLKKMYDVKEGAIRLLQLTSILIMAFAIITQLLFMMLNLKLTMFALLYYSFARFITYIERV